MRTASAKRASFMSATSEPSHRLRRAFHIGLILVAAVFATFLIKTSNTWPQALKLAESKGKDLVYYEQFQGIFWWTAVANLILLIGLAVTARWWLYTATRVTAAPAPAWERPTRWAWVLAGLIMLLALALRVPRLDMSLYNDESHCYHRYLSGAWKNNELKAEPLKFRASPWAETMFRNTAGNNSQLFSSLARFSLEQWKKVFPVAQGEIVETPVRLPSLVAGVLTLGLLGALGWRWCGTQGMLWAMLAGALHGWLVRFQSEARGYGVMLLGVLLMFWFLDSAMRTGRWRHWLGFSLGVLITVWAFLGAAYFLIGIFMVVFGMQVFRWRRAEVDFQQVIRPAIAGLLATIVGSQLLSAFIPPILYQLANFHSIKGSMGSAWWLTISVYHLLGAHWQDYDPTNAQNLAWVRLLSEHPVLWVPVLCLVATVVGAFIQMIRGGSGTCAIALGSLLALVVAWALMTRKGNYLLPWYTIYSTPAFVLAIAWGLTSLSASVRQRLAGAKGTATSIVMGLLLMTPLAVSGIHWSQHCKQDERAAIIHIRGAIYPHYLGTEGEKPLVLVFWSNAPGYDPHTAIMATEADLNTMIARAKAEQRPLFVTFSHRGHAAREHVNVFKRLEDPTEFKHTFTSPGQEEEQFTAYVYEWVGR
jgi:hypothetical protein